MRLALRLAVAVLSVSFVALAAAPAQVAYNEGAVERVVLVRVVPGHFDALMADFKKNIVPLWEAEKKSGLITDYQIFLNTTHSGTEDWDVGYALIYKNMAALDGLPDKVYELRMKQYGDRTAEQKVLDKRYENGELVSSMILRDITLR
jgi:hypothetical protein